jgi:hypothetical protein
MFLKNYTSDVPVSQTIYRIEQVLITCGIQGITKEYGPAGEVLAITFHAKLEGHDKPISVRLPANEAEAQNALWLNYVDGDKLSPDGKSIHWNSRKRRTWASFKDQASRTAWKIVQDWVEVQMSMVQMKQAELMQVFLPYAWDGKRTFFAAMKDNGFKLLTAAKSDP